MKTSIRIVMSIFLCFAFCFFHFPTSAFAYSIGDDYPNKYSCAGCHSIGRGDDHNDYNERLFYYRQCTDFVAWCLISRNGVEDFNNRYGGVTWGNAKNWVNAAESIGIICDKTPAVGAVACWTTGQYGHVAWVEAVNGDEVIIEEYNYGGSTSYNSRPISSDNPNCYIHINDILSPPAPTPVIPDGDYIIAAADDTRYYLDIDGSAYPAVAGTKVQLYYSPDLNVSDADAWTVTYNGDGYYRIRQYRQDISLDVDDESTINGAKVQVWYSNYTPAQQWAISGDANSGYRIKARCSGKYLEYEDSKLESGTKVQQWAYANVPAQNWMFIPYHPTAELDINGQLDGNNTGNVAGYGTFDIYIYINGVLSEVQYGVSDYYNNALPVGTGYEIANIKPADGKSYVGIKNGTRVGILNSNMDIRLGFDTIPDNPGVTPVISTYGGHTYYYYDRPSTWYAAKLLSERMGGHLVTITSAGENSFVKTLTGNSDLWIGATDRDSEGSWKWVTGETFSYSDWGEGQPDNTASPGEGTESYIHIWGETGKWNDNAGCVAYPFICEFDKAYTIRYYANGGTRIPSAQTKAYGQPIELSSIVPTRTGYTFLGWATNASATTVQYQPGASYSTDANLTLYAIWERLGNTITYDANGGEYPPAEQFKPVGETITISNDIPTRRGYTFLGWATSASATKAQYQPGASYSADADLTLYALWRITNPPTLTGNSVSMLAGDTRVLADLVDLHHDGVLDYTLTAIAGGVVSVDGQRVTATAPGTGALIVSVTEYPAATCTVNIRVVDFSNMLNLPAALSKIEDQAFENTDVTAVTLPAACREIGNRAFADNGGLVYVFVPAGVAQIANDAFDNCPNLTVYCYLDSAAAVLAQARGIRYVLLSDDWVPVDALPPGATVTDEKWTYQRSTTETMTSTADNLEGWTQTGFDWQQTGSGTHVYASYPDGFDTGHPLYSAYAKGALTGSTSGNTKREVSVSTVKDYIYWHWTWYWGTSENKLISDQYCIEDGREYDNFKAYENSYIEYVSGQNYVNWDRGGEEDGSCWWFRFDVCQQSYTDYQKLFTYTRMVTTDETSTTPVAPSGTISNVLHWVKYEL